MNKEDRNRIKDALLRSTESELVSTWNTYCDETRYYDSEIHSMDEFDNKMDGVSPRGIAEFLADDYAKNFNIYDKYFCDNIDALKSSNNPMELGLNTDMMVNFIAKTKLPLNNYRVYDALNNPNLYDATYSRKRLKFYTKSINSDKLYICYTEEQAKRLVAAIPDAAKANIVIAENDMEFRRLWREPKFDGLNIDKAAVIYDASNDETDMTNRCFMLNLDNKQCCAINMCEIENHQEYIKPLDNGLEM